jgi:hypothetical protein
LQALQSREMAALALGEKMNATGAPVSEASPSENGHEGRGGDGEEEEEGKGEREEQDENVHEAMAELSLSNEAEEAGPEEGEPVNGERARKHTAPRNRHRNGNGNGNGNAAGNNGPASGKEVPATQAQEAPELTVNNKQARA